MKMITVSEDALNSIKSMAQKLQDEAEMLRDKLKVAQAELQALREMLIGPEAK